MASKMRSVTINKIAKLEWMMVYNFQLKFEISFYCINLRLSKLFWLAVLESLLCTLFFRMDALILWVTPQCNFGSSRTVQWHVPIPFSPDVRLAHDAAFSMQFYNCQNIFSVYNKSSLHFHFHYVWVAGVVVVVVDAAVARLTQTLTLMLL